MPQLDIYTFPTQIYFFALFFFFCLLFVVRFLLTLFFKSELLEQEEIHTLDNAFLIQTNQYGRQQTTPLVLFPLLEKYLLATTPNYK